jgi:hypothetical protein
MGNPNPTDQCDKAECNADFVSDGLERICALQKVARLRPNRNCASMNKFQAILEDRTARCISPHATVRLGASTPFSDTGPCILRGGRCGERQTKAAAGVNLSCVSQ